MRRIDAWLNASIFRSHALEPAFYPQFEKLAVNNKPNHQMSFKTD